MGRHGKDVLGHHGNEANLVLGHHGNKAKLVLGHFPVSNERSQASFRCMTLVLLLCWKLYFNTTNLE